jgi:hypothetical protein
MKEQSQERSTIARRAVRKLYTDSQSGLKSICRLKNNLSIEIKECRMAIRAVNST